MKKGFTLIELLFVIVIIGFLAVIAVPKFMNLTTNAKKASIKSIVTSVQDSIENIHSQWLVNEDFTWTGADGEDLSSDFNNTSGYPLSLDSGKDEEELFKYVLKIPIYYCGDKTQNCWDEYDDNKYEYIFNPNKKLRLEYNSSNGLLECIDGVGITQEDCEKIIY